MSLGFTVFRSFVEGWRKKKVLWYKKGYDEVAVDHPEVKAHLTIVQRAIESPSMVYPDKDNPRRFCYYAAYPGVSQYPNMHMKVVIQENRFGRLKVITAFFTTNIKEKGTQCLWPTT